MTAWANNLNGIASGTNVSTANSGGVSGTAFNQVTTFNGGSVTALAAAAFEGATGLRVVLPAVGSTAYAVWTTTSAVGARVSSSFWFKYAAAPTAANIFYDNVNGPYLQVTTAGTIQVGVGASTVLATSTAVPADTWVFIQHAWTPQSTATSKAECRITGATGTVHLDYTSTATLAAGVANTSVEFGRRTNTTVASTFSYDLLAADNTLTSGFPGAGAPAPAFTGGLKVWTGSAWAIKPVKLWNGTAWVTKPVKRWNGTAWVTLP